jgi:uncharacterized repeat protein (TIGR03803 family)
MGKLSLPVELFTVFIFCAAAAIESPAQTFTNLVVFNLSDGANNQYGSMVQGANGNLYGTTTYGGIQGCPPPYGCGTVFAMTPAGSLKTLWDFETDGSGALPVAGLVQARGGNFYGTTLDGGANSCGSIYKMTPEGALTTLYNFGCYSSVAPQSALMQGVNGDLYGTTGGGGTVGVGGTIFKITPSGSFTLLYSFCSQSNCPDAAGDFDGLVLGPDGNFYGTTGSTVFKIAPTGDFTTLYSFCSQPDCADGSNPLSVLALGTDGDFYGTTANGGANGNYGTVYKITPQGKLTTLHSFDGTDGSQPSGTLFYASDGNFYGTTQFGGANTDGGQNPAGTVFKITPEGRLTTLYNFCSEEYCTDGESPEAGVIQDTNGNLYGTTMLGGYIGCATYNYGCGTVFMVSARLPEFIEPQPTFGKESEEIEILGTNLTEAKSVLFNGTAAAFKVISASEIAAQVPAGATTGKIAVTTATRALSSILPFKVIP